MGQEHRAAEQRTLDHKYLFLFVNLIVYMVQCVLTCSQQKGHYFKIKNENPAGLLRLFECNAEQCY